MTAVFVPAYIGLGSNLDDPVRQIRAALTALAGIPASRLVASSALYQNPPMGPQQQPEFVNAVAGVLTCLPPEALLAAMQAIERAQGRRRDGPRWGPRTLDLDLLLYGDRRMQSPSLTVPHPGLAERPFVLVPLLELAPALRLPDGTLVSQLAAAAGEGGLVRVAH